MSKENFPSTIAVHGAGLVQVEPDEAVVHLSVITEAKTAVEASQGNATRTQAVVDAVSDRPNHGITTRGLSVRPITTYEAQTRTTTIIGFRATLDVVVRTKVGYAGQIFDAGIAAGANQSSGIEFRRQDERPHRDQALRLAVEEATSDATIAAKAAGVDLLGPQTIEIDRGPDAGPPTRMLSVEASTPVMPEALTISAHVRIVFATKWR